MKININSWHFKLFNMFSTNSTWEYLPPDKDDRFPHKQLTVTDCQYFRNIVFKAFVILLIAAVVSFFSFVIVSILLEPWLVLGNALLGDWGIFAKENGEHNMRMAYTGAFLNVAIVIFVALFKGMSWYRNSDIYVSESLKERFGDNSFPSLMYQRYRNWKDKVCHKIDFTKE